MTKEKIIDRKEIAYKEATRDPIFLFQERKVTLKSRIRYVCRMG